MLLLGAGAALGLLLLNSVHKADTRVAALAIFGLGLWVLTVPLGLAMLWQVSAEWRRLNYSPGGCSSDGCEASRTEPSLASSADPASTVARVA